MEIPDPVKPTGDPRIRRDVCTVSDTGRLEK